MCPDPALLVAYLDGTLFHRDAAAVDKHLETCAECAALLASIRQRRESEQAAHASRRRMIAAAALVSVVVVAAGLWLLRPSSPSEPVADTAPVRSEAPPPPAPVVSAPTPAPAAPAPTAPPRREPARRAAAPPPAPTSRPAPLTRAERRRQRQQAAASASAAADTRAAKVPRPMWRTRDAIVESSADGGTTWATEHTADRPIRASVFIDANVAWVVGDNGLILRRTKNGWFGASPPAEGHITAVKASSPSKATVTLEDGRVFSTTNGGVTWAPTP
jgi:hypothetical protein